MGAKKKSTPVFIYCVAGVVAVVLAACGVAVWLCCCRKHRQAEPPKKEQVPAAPTNAYHDRHQMPSQDLGSHNSQAFKNYASKTFQELEAPSSGPGNQPLV
jgi:hypothetical protein